MGPAGQYVVATRAFEQAYELAPLPAISFSTAQALRLQFFVDHKPAGLQRAIARYRRYIEATPSGGRRQDAVTSLAEIEPIFMRLSAEAPTAPPEPPELPTQLMITSAIAGAWGTVDGAVQQDLPMVLDVSPGPHTITAGAEAHDVIKLDVLAAERRLAVVEVELKPQPARLVIDADLSADVHINGLIKGRTPISLKLPPGPAEVSLVGSGVVPWSRSIQLKPNAEVELKLQLRRTTQRSAAHAVLLAALTGLAAGAGVGVAALVDDGSAADINQRRLSSGISPAELAEYERLVDRRDGRRTATYIVAGSSVLLGIVGGALYLLESPRLP